MEGNYDFPIKKCPNCGGTWMKIEQKIYGYGTYCIDLETQEVESSTLHDSLMYKNTKKYGYCVDCGKRLFEIPKNMC